MRFHGSEEVGARFSGSKASWTGRVTRINLNVEAVTIHQS
jgi:hypothetical protein